MQTTASPTAASPNRKALVIVLLAFVAVLITQITHEMTHAVAMWLVGTGVEAIQLFAVQGNPVTDPNAQMIISGSAAIFNVVVGLLCVVLFYTVARRNTLARLLTLYLAGYMLMTGFGYFMVDALFYAPDAPFFPDWQYVIHLLGGGWDVRLPLLLIGVVGLLGVFFWLPNAALRFVTTPTDKAVRVREMLLLTLVPYVVVNVVLTVLSISHPLGIQGVVLAVFQYWFGYIALFWAFFIGGQWTNVKADFKDATAIAHPVLPVWLMASAALWAVLAFIMVPGIWF